MQKTISPLLNHELAIQFKETMRNTRGAKIKRALAKIRFGDTSVTNFDKALAFAEKHPENHQIFNLGGPCRLHEGQGINIVRKNPYRIAEYDNDGVLRYIHKDSGHGRIVLNVVDRVNDIYIRGENFVRRHKSSFKGVLGAVRKIEQRYHDAIREQCVIPIKDAIFQPVGLITKFRNKMSNLLDRQSALRNSDKAKEFAIRHPETYSINNKVLGRPGYTNITRECNNRANDYDIRVTHFDNYGKKTGVTRRFNNDVVIQHDLIGNYDIWSRRHIFPGGDNETRVHFKNFKEMLRYFRENLPKLNNNKDI